jgi:hypothetical protein
MAIGPRSPFRWRWLPAGTRKAGGRRGAHFRSIEARADGIPVGVFAHGGYRAGRALGPHRGVGGRRSVSWARRLHARWVKGYQQGDLSKPDSVAVSVKHFAAYGAAIAGRDYNATDMSDITLAPGLSAAVSRGR